MGRAAIVFDIETGPLPPEIVLPLSGNPPVPPEPGPFDPAAVKVGNIKDREKIEAKIEEAREAHAAKVAGYKAEADAAIREWKRQALDRAPLSALTGRVMAVGRWMSDSGNVVMEFAGDPADEPAILESTWRVIDLVRLHGVIVCGWNIHGFDLPFLMRRSWILGVPVPSGLIEKGRFWHANIIDLMQVWACTTRDMAKLDTVSRAFTVGTKLGDGSQFWQLMASEPDAAAAYLRQDVELTVEVAKRMGVIR